MANLDGGHYFLSTLIPLRTDPLVRPDGSFTVPSHLLREVLSSLPTARQSPATALSLLNSPFARCVRTHFVRAVVIDQPMYNGRDGGDALAQALRKTNLLQAGPVDRLKCPYLMFNADFDARQDEADGGLLSWASGLWASAEPELRAVFSSCLAFDQVVDGATFGHWLKRCQIETTMSFNDYYEPMPDLHGYTLPGVGRAIGAVAVLGAAVAAWGVMAAQASWWWMVLWVPVALLAGLAVAALALWRKGSQPFPAGAGTDLPAVLKALHLQQHFALLVAELQGADEATVHRRFAEFLRQLQPDNLAAPTQAPGVIRSDGVALVTHQQVAAKAEAA